VFGGLLSLLLASREMKMACLDSRASPCCCMARFLKHLQAWPRRNGRIGWSQAHSLSKSYLRIHEVVRELFMLTLPYTPSHTALVTNTIILRIKIRCTWKRCVSMIWIHSDNRFQVLPAVNRKFRVSSFKQILSNSSTRSTVWNFLWGVGSPHHSAQLSSCKFFVWWK
jgi:hypothetical protein